ncbi:MAG: hypothetical protein ACRDFA_09195 [bacterium]
MMIRWAAGLALLAVLLAPIQAFTECTCLPLWTFTPKERQRFETQYGQNWWQALGLIPGPQTAGDYVERPFGDSSMIIYSPQHFWDPRPCAINTDRLARPRSGLHCLPDSLDPARAEGG